MNKKLLIGLGVLAVAGIGVYMWKRRKDEETKSNAIGRRNLISGKGNLGGGIVNIADPKTLCCPNGEAWCDHPVRCKDVSGEPKEMPKDLSFSGAVGSFGSVSLGTNVIQQQQNCDAGKKWCKKRQPDGSIAEGCFCNEPKPVGTTTTTSGFHGCDGGCNCNQCPFKNQCPRYVEPIDNNTPIFKGRRVASVATPYIPNIYYGVNGVVPMFTPKPITSKQIMLVDPANR